MIATNDGARLAYEELGSGEPVLLIHGLAYGKRGWGEFPEHLARDFRVITFDNRGIGESNVPPGPYSVQVMAADAVAVLDAAGLERAHVFGASLGGMIAQALALEAPGRVDKLVLACTTPGGEGAHPLPERAQKLFAEFPTLPLEVALRRSVENTVSDETVATRPELVERIYAYRLENPPPPAGWQAQYDAAMAHDAFERLGDIRAPTLVIAGTGDNVIDHRNSQVLADRIPNARLEVLDGAGHSFWWEQPERLASIVAEFLR